MTVGRERFSSLAARNFGPDAVRQDPELFGTPAERAALGDVGREIADQVAIGGVGEQLFPPGFEIVHGRAEVHKVAVRRRSFRN
jgi:hypothetical protein